MSYMEFFQNNLRKNIDDKIKAIEGTCNAMCPEEEVTLRVREKLVHVLEVVGGEHKLVKCYARSAADTNLAVARNTRPLHILKDTVQYLLFEVTKRTVSSLVKYNFITDRLRAVRQEMIIQNFCPRNCIVLLEPMIRFHVYFGYLLCELSVQDYSPTLNRNFLLECLKMCLRCYDELDGQSAENPDVDALVSTIFGCSLEEKNRMPLDRGLMEALYILTNFFDEQPLYRFTKLPQSLRAQPTVELAFKIAVARLHGYHFKVCALTRKLCPLSYCAVSLYLPEVQRNGIRVLNAAYGSRNGSVPLSVVREWLCFGSAAEAQRACGQYGLAVHGGAVLCRRGACVDVDTLPPKRCTPEHLKGKMKLKSVLSYTTQLNM